jgi:hypothetical protein
VDADALVVDPTHLAFSPQYPLWTDGAAKERWISLPAGSVIDASDPNAWQFPVGTRFWKQFSFAGRPIETRYMEQVAEGEWLYAAYEWSADGREAVLAPAVGRREAFDLGGGRFHAIPGVADCKVCHQGQPTEVLGFAALQLSPDRDRAALHADADAAARVDLDELFARGLIAGVDQSALNARAHITARSETERVALGYLHGNCGHCHNSGGPLANVGLLLKQEFGMPRTAVLDSLVGHAVRKPAPGQSDDAVLRIDPGRPQLSALLERVASRYAALQMPPLGTALVDEEAVALLSRWIAELQTQTDFTTTRENQR